MTDLRDIVLAVLLLNADGFQALTDCPGLRIFGPRGSAGSEPGRLSTDR